MSQRQIWLFFQFSFLRVRRRKKTDHYMQNLNGARAFYFVEQISSEKHALLIHIHVCTVQCTPVYKWKHMISGTHFVCKCMWRVCGCVWKLTRRLGRLGYFPIIFILFSLSNILQWTKIVRHLFWLHIVNQAYGVKTSQFFKICICRKCNV